MTRYWFEHYHAAPVRQSARGIVPLGWQLVRASAARADLVKPIHGYRKERADG